MKHIQKYKKGENIEKKNIFSLQFPSPSLSYQFFTILRLFKANKEDTKE